MTAPASVYTAPASGGKYNAAGWPGSITGTASDGGSGLATVQVAIQQGAGNYYDGAAFNNAGITWLAATGTSSWSYAIAAAKLTTGNTYTISVRSTDNVGNVETAVTRSFLYDTVAPSFGTLAIGSPVNASVTGTTIYYRGNTTGSFTLSQPLTDADAGPTSVQYPAIATAGWTHNNETVSGASPYVSTSFSWTSSPTNPTGYTLTGTDQAGNTAPRALTFTSDTAVPTGGALTVNGTAATGGGSTSVSSGSFAISRTDYTDANSGIATSTLTRDSATYTNDACGTYTGSPTTIVGTPAQSLSTGCYRYVLTGTDARRQRRQHQHGRPGARRRRQHRPDRLDREPHLRLDARADGDDQGRGREHRRHRQHDLGQLHAGERHRLGHRHRRLDRELRRRDQDRSPAALAGTVTMQATAGGLTTGTLGAFTVTHGAAVPARADRLDRQPRVGHAPASSPRRCRTRPATRSPPTTPPPSPSPSRAARARSAAPRERSRSRPASPRRRSRAQLIGTVTTNATASGLTTGTLGAFTVTPGTASPGRPRRARPPT